MEGVKVGSVEIGDLGCVEIDYCEWGGIYVVEKLCWSGSWNLFWYCGAGVEYCTKYQNIGNMGIKRKCPILIMGFFWCMRHVVVVVWRTHLLLKIPKNWVSFKCVPGKNVLHSLMFCLLFLPWNLTVIGVVWWWYGRCNYCSEMKWLLVVHHT